MLGAVENTRIQPNGYQTKQKTYIARYCILDLPPLSGNVVPMILPKIKTSN